MAEEIVHRAIEDDWWLEFLADAYLREIGFHNCMMVENGADNDDNKAAEDIEYEETHRRR